LQKPPTTQILEEVFRMPTKKEVVQAERRAEPRARVDRIAVRLHVRGRVESGYLANINNTGAFIATTALLPEGTPVAVEIEVPSPGRLPLLHAEVVRAKNANLPVAGEGPQGIAVKFLAETEEGRSRIHLAVQTALAIDLIDDGPRKGNAVSDETRPYRRRR
jgi:hypothetical protein